MCVWQEARLIDADWRRAVQMDLTYLLTYFLTWILSASYSVCRVEDIGNLGGVMKYCMVWQLWFMCVICRMPVKTHLQSDRFYVVWDVKLYWLTDSLTALWYVWMHEGKKFLTACMRRLLRRGLKLSMPWHALPSDLVPTQVTLLILIIYTLVILLTANHW